MIPKTIHYCWIGNNPLPDLAIKCIESWKKYCPDYEIIQWNESNYDFGKNTYMKQAYEAKKWGFVPDYARLDIVYTFGGIYLDTDVELLRSLDDVLENKGFAGMESEGVVNLGVGFGAEAGNPIIKALLDDYEQRQFIKENGQFDLTPSPLIQTDVLRRCYGLKDKNSIQRIGQGFTVYPTEYFCPKDFKTGKLILTENTFSIHHFDASWVGEKSKFYNITRWKLSKCLPPTIASYIALFLATVKYEGLLSALKKIIKNVKKSS